MSESYQILDTRFRALIDESAPPVKLWTGGRFGEGPAHFPAARHVLWSDIPNDRILKFDECSGQVAEFRAPCGFANGNTVDRQGRLITCEHGNRRVTRTEPDGAITVVADSYRGKRLNSPNDVVVKSDGSIWFSDPTYGIDDDTFGRRAASEIGAQHVYRVDPATGAVEIAADDFIQPNGLAFSPDESLLYVADTGRTHKKDGPFHMRVFEVGKEGKLRGARVFADCDPGAFDGFRLDEQGRVWTSAGPRVNCYLPDGTLLGWIKLPEGVANVCFGGPARRRLYIAAGTSLYAIELKVAGAKTF